MGLAKAVSSPHMKKYRFAIALLALAVGLPLVATAVTPRGQRLADFLDSLDVENHWIAGAHVHWESGNPDGRPVSSEGVHSHCSAFVASACERLGVYILRPPEHGQTFLANAQYDWLMVEGPRNGWTPLADGFRAQEAANHGQLVIAAYKNPKPRKSGHIAIVRPSDKPSSAILSEGPQVIAAGEENYTSAPLKVSFRHHPAAWRDHEVRFFEHAAQVP